MKPRQHALNNQGVLYCSQDQKVSFSYLKLNRLGHLELRLGLRHRKLLSPLVVRSVSPMSAKKGRN